MNMSENIVPFMSNKEIIFDDGTKVYYSGATENDLKG
jgi:hypothetical protein